jgi:hypothetical protein
MLRAPERPWRLIAVIAAAAATGASCGNSTEATDGGSNEASTDARSRDASPDRSQPQDSGPDDMIEDGSQTDARGQEAAMDAGVGDARRDAPADVLVDRFDARGDEDGAWVFAEGATASTFCLTESDGAPYCFGTESFPATELAGLKADCTGTSMGTVETVCPKKGLVGCCALTPGTETVVKCYYDAPDGGAGGPDAGSLKASCKSDLGTWTKSPP